MPMADEKHKVFISYHHANDQAYKEALLDANRRFGLFVDCSVDTDDIDEDLDDDAIRRIIRDDYLQDSTVTIVLVGTETKYRKHIDWEIYSSMYDGAVNKKSGVLVINLPSTGCTYYTAAHGDVEKQTVYPVTKNWISINKRAEYESRYPLMPDRIIDNLLKSGSKVSVTNWDTFASDVEKLRLLINLTFNERTTCDYDLSRPMRRANAATRG
jgi:antiphage defense system Thoeris ThsB-like protein